MLTDGDTDAQGHISGYAVQPFVAADLPAIVSKVRAGDLCFAVTGAALQALFEEQRIEVVRDFLVHVRLAGIVCARPSFMRRVVAALLSGRLQCLLECRRLKKRKC